MKASEATVRRQLKLSMAMPGMSRGRGCNSEMPVGSGNFFINDTAKDISVINQTVKPDTTEIWEVYNDSTMMHPFQIHHGVFQIPDRDGHRPPVDEMDLKDSVKAGLGQTERFIMRFEDFSDAQTTYVYHCHTLEHEDNGMMGQFVVV
jgi:blue copper oxidase